MLRIRSRKFYQLFPHLKTDEQKAEKFLDEYYQSKSVHAMGKKYNLSDNTVNAILKDLEEQNPKFWDRYHERWEERIRDFADMELGNNLYKHYMAEIEECEKNYADLVKYVGDKNNPIPEEARQWKKMKYELLKTLVGIHRDFLKMYTGEGKSAPRGTIRSNDDAHNLENDKLDQEISKEAKRLQ